MNEFKNISGFHEFFKTRLKISFKISYHNGNKNYFCALLGIYA